MFERTMEFLTGREHRLVRDYLAMSMVLLIAATALGAWLSNRFDGADPMPVASIDRKTQVDGRVYTIVRSVLHDGEALRVASEAPVTDADPIATGSVRDGLSRVTIDPCTGETKR